MNQTHSTQPNLDPSEVRKFDDQAHQWWDPEGNFKPLHQINPLRLDFISRNTQLEQAAIVDIGCGGGILAEGLAGLGARVTGIDQAEDTLEVASMHLHESGYNIDYRHCRAEELATSHEGAFDVVTCMEMLEHVPDPASIITACAQLAAPGADLFFSTLNRSIKGYLHAILGAEYILGMLPRGTHDYARFIKPSELARWLRSSGLTVGEMAGVTYRPLTREYALTDDLSVNYMVHARKPSQDA